MVANGVYGQRCAVIRIITTYLHDDRTSSIKRQRINGLGFRPLLNRRVKFVFTRNVFDTILLQSNAPERPIVFFPRVFCIEIIVVPLASRELSQICF